MQTNEKIVLNREYSIIKVLGKGGMGCVYLAKDIADDSNWAVKEITISQMNKELVYSEIHLLERMNHSALPKIRENMQIGNKVYIVMEYVNGPTIAEVLEQGGHLPEEKVLDWSLQIVDVLQYLHSIDPPVVYRDLKPANIMLDSSGKIRIIDFGIAQEYSSEEGYSSKKVVLTRGYAAPEQYDSRYKSDVRTDIYALGVTMHYLSTGKNPNTPPYYFQPIRKLNSNASLAMEFIIKKCLWPQPDKRYQDAGSLKYDLLHIKEVQKQEENKRRKKRIIGVCISFLVVALSIVLFIGIKNLRGYGYEAYRETILNAEKYMSEDNFEEAYKEIEKAIDLCPDIEDAYIKMAYWYMDQGLYEEAATYVKSDILTRFPDIFSNIDFLDMMGDCYYGLGDYESAKYYYLLCLDIDSDNQYFENKLNDCMMQGGN